MELKSIPYSPEWKVDWDRFCETSEDAWFFHTTSWIEFWRAYQREEASPECSFLLVDTDGIQAICPLVIEHHPMYDEREFGGFNAGRLRGPAPAVNTRLTPQRRQEVLAAAYAQIDILAQEQGVARLSVEHSPLAPGSVVGEGSNEILRYGFLDVSFTTQVLSLNQGVDALWRDIRRGHRSDIKRGLLAIETEVFHGPGVSVEEFDAYREMHHRDAGRITRPMRTFSIQHEWILNGRAVLIGSKYQGEWVGFNYLMLHGTGAYYLSACEEPDVHVPVPVGHALQWTAIQWLKDQGYERYEIGRQYFGAQLHDAPSAKEISISNFKRRFGGKAITAHAGERYYSRTFFETVAAQRIATYAEGLTN
jgi:hypothetical protein